MILAQYIYICCNISISLQFAESHSDEELVIDSASTHQTALHPVHHGLLSRLILPVGKVRPIQRCDHKRLSTSLLMSSIP